MRFSYYINDYKVSYCSVCLKLPANQPSLQPQEFGAKYDEKLSLEISNHPFNFQRSCVRTLFLENPISSTQCHSVPLVTGYIHF